MPAEEYAEGLRRTKTLVENFLLRPDSGPFREPVDWKALELFDYPELIQTPMDLGTILRKLEKDEYQNAAYAAEDIKLVWSNCMRYNAEHSDFYVLAKKFSRRFEDAFRTIRRETEIGFIEEDEDEERNGNGDSEMEDSTSEEELEDEDGLEEEEEEDIDGKMEEALQKPKAPPSKLDQRAYVAEQILNLRGVHLGKVVNLLYKHCPECVIQDPKLETLLELNLDSIPANVLNTISEIVQEFAIYRKPKALKITKTKSKKRGRPRLDNRDILQIDTATGQVVNVFSSLSAAGGSVGFSRHIVAAILRGNYKSNSYKGWTFRYDFDEDDDQGQDDTPTKRKKTGNVRAVSVLEIDARTGQLLQVHPSLTKAAKKSGANRHIISKVLSGELDSWEGYIWRYEGQELLASS